MKAGHFLRQLEQTKQHGLVWLKPLEVSLVRISSQLIDFNLVWGFHFLYESTQNQLDPLIRLILLICFI